MAINYSFVVRSENLAEKSKKRRVYAAAQSTETVTIRDIAEHIASHNSVFSEGTIIGLLQDAQRCIMERLLSGARVDLEDLGAFYTTIASHGAQSTEEFDESLIKRINLRWKPSKRMTQAIRNVELRPVATRAEQRRVMRMMRQQVDEEIQTENPENASTQM